MSIQPTGERLTVYYPGIITLEHMHRYAIACHVAKGKKVLDIACGEGYGANLLAQAAIEVTGADINQETIAAARKKYGRSNLKFETASTLALPFPDASFDMVVSFETLEHLEEQQQMIAELKRVLRSGGLLIISTPDKKNYTDKTGHLNPFHVKELYRPDFEQLLQSYFTHTDIHSQYAGLYSVCCSAASQDAPLVFSGNFDELNAPTSGSAPFLIALASDNIIPELPVTLFEDSGLLHQLQQEFADDIRRTMSYRLGHFLLSPVRWLRKLLMK